MKNLKSNNTFVSTPDNPTPFYDPFSTITLEGGYSGECQRCGENFIGYKRQLYCSKCITVVKEEKWKEEIEKNNKEIEELKSVLKGIYVTLGKLLEEI